MNITIPYTVANFADLRERGFYYVDKTGFIPRPEQYNVPVFLRLRRSEKSLLISTLAHYYDRSKAHRFEALFGGTWIGAYPTKKHNQYIIIHFARSHNLPKIYILIDEYDNFATYIIYIAAGKACNTWKV